MRKLTRRQFILAASLTITFILHAGIAGATAIPKGVIQLTGSPAPALKLADLDGKDVDLANAKGQWVFVHFWASWCGPCRKEMPTIDAIINHPDIDGLTFILVNTAENEDIVFSFLAEYAPGLNSLLDTDGLVTEQWQPRGLPATFLVDPMGKVRYVALGGRPWDASPYLQFLQYLVKTNPG
jgi:thiol-disulfide isomerase/thioredoxin